MLALADHADDTGKCYPSIQRLCQRTGLGERAVQNNLRSLQDQGYLKVKTGGGRGGANVYFINVNPALETPFYKPRFRNPVSNSKNPASNSKNPAPDAPEPSRTIRNLVVGVSARGAEDKDVEESGGPTFRERLLEAMGVGPDGIAGPSRFIGTQADMAEAKRWMDMPAMTNDAICEEVRRIMSGKRDGPPSSFKYFTEAMRKLSGALSADRLDPVAAPEPKRAHKIPDSVFTIDRRSYDDER